MPNSLIGPLEPSMLDRIQARVAQGQWSRPPMRVLMYNNFDLTTGSVLLMIFPPGARVPDVVVKLCRDATVVQREYEHLQAVCRMCRQRRYSSIPLTPLASSACDQFPAGGWPRGKSAWIGYQR